MSNIFEALAAAQSSSQFAQDLMGRSLGLQFGIVTNTDDPLKIRRIKCTIESKGGLTETDWLMALKVIPNYDPPIPPIGSSVILGFIDGNPHDGVYLGSTINQTNTQDDGQADPVADSTLTIPGDEKETIGGNSTHTIEGDFTHTTKGNVEETIEGTAETLIKKALSHTVEQVENRRTNLNLTIDCGLTLTLRNDAGASLTLTAAGAIVLGDAYGNQIILSANQVNSGSPAGMMFNLTDNATIDLNGRSINIVNAGGVSINGKQVAVVGAVDSAGHTVVNRGY